MNRLMKAFMAAAALTTVASAGVFAHGGAKGIVKERMTMMDSLGKSLKELTSMMRGKTPYDANRVRQIAKTMQNHGGESMTKLFPKGSLDRPTEALPTIWDDWPRFQQLAKQLADYSNALEKSANNPRPNSTGNMGMAPAASMMGGDMMQGGMMQGGMMTSEPALPDPVQLESMPPDAAFMHVSQTCGSCHETFRKKK